MRPENTVNGRAQVGCVPARAVAKPVLLLLLLPCPVSACFGDEQSLL